MAHQNKAGARQAVRSAAAPAPVGPYAQAVVHGGVVYVSGQLPLDPASGKMIEGEIEAQAERVFRNIAAVLDAAGSSTAQVLRAAIYLMDLADFPRVNDVYARHFRGEPLPARSTIGVAALPLGAAIEVDVVAALPEA